MTWAAWKQPKAYSVVGWFANEKRVTCQLVAKSRTNVWITVVNQRPNRSWVYDSICRCASNPATATALERLILRTFSWVSIRSSESVYCWVISAGSPAVSQPKITQIFPVFHGLPRQVLPIIQPGSPERLLSDFKTQRLHQPKLRLERNAGAADGTRIGWNLWLVQNDMNGRFVTHGLTVLLCFLGAGKNGIIGAKLRT